MFGLGGWTLEFPAGLYQIVAKGVGLQVAKNFLL